METTKVECLETPPLGTTVLEDLDRAAKTNQGKRGLESSGAATRKERQAKYTKKTRNAGVFERFVRDSAGMDSGSRGGTSKRLRLFDETGFRKACGLLQLDYDRGKERSLETVYQQHTFDALGKIGFGIASPTLVANLLKDLFGRTPTGWDQCKFANLKPEAGKGNTDKATYAFFHWDQNGDGNTGVITDYRLRKYFLSNRTVREIDSLGFGICRALFPGKFEILTDTEMKDHILLLPGMVSTKKAHDQALHVDGKAGEILFLLHFPLCEEGMMLRVWGTQREGISRRQKSYYLKIPFGSYAITRGDVYHAGIYGCSGNFRFHMIVKEAGRFSVSDKIHRMTGDIAPVPNTWKGIMYARDDMLTFSENYLALLREKCACVMEDAWTKPIQW